MFQPLQRGDKIGIFSSSVPATSTAKLRYDRGKEFLQAKGFHIIEGNLTGKQDGYRSGTPKERAEEFNQLLRDPSIKMIMSSIGGTNSNSLLPYIDYEAFKNNPKIVIGYSDTTAILLALFAKTNIPTYYGPALIPSFGEFEPLVHETYNYFKHYFSQPSVQYTIPMSPVWSDEMINWLTYEKPKTLYSNKWISFHEGVVEGRLIGGNNNTMYGFIGTPYFPVIKNGDILLIEDSLKSASTVEKNLAMLKLHGIFDKVGGIILGKHELFDDEGTGKQPLDLLLEQLDGKIIPILADVDCAHTHPMFPLAIGKKICLDTITQTITCIEHWL
ncbi:S66 peptidase family protein [Solibacillus sp. FSL W7-1472]|uniref:S66 family peptidase n=1 Tax=Solibacillus sp. FSL W7-1472 TaxID=2921707 RepID=UPI0030DC54EE